ncbi:alpha/beta hydrolase domain-containing protein [Nonomuraea sp. NPDC049480]|uniref:alpha/beta hydrolase domain-containing protein n=1 Tax=Nonomuraea sp. NPDC049480 TaxID=3364353 RepID=UPI0037B177BD
MTIARANLRLAIVLTLLLTLLPAAATATAASAVPTVTVERVQAPGTRMLGASAVDLKARGYVEQEYYVSGRASRYRMAGAADASIVDRGWPYVTRIVVRKPARSQRFNGTVVVEWNNVTGGQDIDFSWAASHDHLMREGYAWVGVTAQRVGVEQLRRWSPQRYGRLTVDASNTDPATGGLLEPPAWPYAGGDVLAWDIFSQVGRTLRTHAAAQDPLAGLGVRRLIANGQSQSAGRLTAYYNSIQRLHGVYDGFVYYDGAGALRDDISVPAVSMESEWLNGTQRDPAATPQDTAYSRHWEVAGTSHIALDDARYVDAMVLRDGSLLAPDNTPVTLTGLIRDCQYQPLWSNVPNGLVLNAAFDHVNTWIRGGPAAPRAPRFERDLNASPATLKRDDSGQVLGGIRPPQFAVPTAAVRASNLGPGFCTLAGHHRFYSREELRQRYGNHGRYVSKVATAAATARYAGFLLPEDANAIIRKAAASDVGR